MTVCSILQKKFDSIEGFDDVVDNGLVKFKGLDSCRKIALKYKGKKYELGLFNYIRDNGNNLGIRNGQTIKLSLCIFWQNLF